MNGALDAATLDDVVSELVQGREVMQALLAEIRALRLLTEARGAGPLVPDHEADERVGGNPVVRFDPKSWSGPSFKGKKYADAPPEYLDLLASALTQMAAKAAAAGEMYKGKPSAPYRYKDAARARRWAYRKRTGWVAPEKPANGFGSGAAAEEPKPFGNGGGFSTGAFGTPAPAPAPTPAPAAAPTASPATAAPASAPADDFDGFPASGPDDFGGDDFPEPPENAGDAWEAPAR